MDTSTTDSLWELILQEPLLLWSIVAGFSIIVFAIALGVIVPRWRQSRARRLAALRAAEAAAPARPVVEDPLANLPLSTFDVEDPPELPLDAEILSDSVAGGSSASAGTVVTDSGEQSDAPPAVNDLTAPMQSGDVAGKDLVENTGGAPDLSALGQGGDDGDDEEDEDLGSLASIFSEEDIIDPRVQALRDSLSPVDVRTLAVEAGRIAAELTEMNQARG